MIWWQSLQRYWNAPKREAQLREQLAGITEQIVRLRTENEKLLMLVRALRDVNASLDQRLLGMKAQS